MSLLCLLNDLQSLWTTAFQSVPPTQSVFPCLTETAEGQKHAQYMMVQITTHTLSLTYDAWQSSSGLSKITIMPLQECSEVGHVRGSSSHLLKVFFCFLLPRVGTIHWHENWDISRLPIDNLIFKHDTPKWGFMLRERCWHLDWCTTHAYLLCIGVFTRPTPKNLLLPICLSVCLSG